MSNTAKKAEDGRPPMLLGVSTVRVFVSDLRRALEFYTGPLALRVSATDDSSWVLFRLSNAGLLIESVSGASGESREHKELVGRFTGVSFDTDDIQRAFDELSALGVRFEGPPERQFWGGTLAHFYDSAGNVLTLVERAKS